MSKVTYTVFQVDVESGTRYECFIGDWRECKRYCEDEGFTPLPNDNYRSAVYTIVPNDSSIRNLVIERNAAA